MSGYSNIRQYWPVWGHICFLFSDYLCCLQNSFVVHTALTDLVIQVLLNSCPFSVVCISMFHNFKPSSFSRRCASKYMTIPLNANPMIPESSPLDKPRNRSLAQLKNDDTHGIFNTGLYCALLMSDGPFLNQLLWKKSMPRLKFDWWDCISQYYSV